MAEIDGIEELKAALSGLDKKLQNKVIRKAIRDGAKVLANEVKSRAPVETGALKKSVKVRAGKRKKDVINVQVEITGGHDTPMVGAVEFGTATQQPKPFIVPAFDARQEEIKQMIFDQILASLNT